MTLFARPGLPLNASYYHQTRILVVEDEPDIAQALHDYLTNQTGYQVVIVYDGRAAMNALVEACHSAAGPFDLVLLDMRMPGVTGQQVLQWIRQHPELQYTRVVILTATTTTEERVDALSAGADDYITKPYHHQELLARVNTILRSHRLEKRLQYQGRQLALLNEVSAVLTSMRDPKLVFEAAVEGARHILNVELAGIFVYLERQGKLFCRQLSANVLPLPAYPPIAANQGSIGLVFTRQQLLCLNTPHTDDRFQPSDAPTGYAVQNLLAAPLQVRARSVGVLVTLNKADGSFGEVDIALFAALANVVGRAVENAWLFQSVRQQQQALLKGRDRLQAIIDGILHPIYTVDEQWRITAVNKSTLDEHKATAGDLIDQVCYQALFGRNAPCAGCVAAQTMRHKTTSGWSARWLDMDQLPREWEVNAYPIPGRKTESAQAVVVWQDVTEKRRLQNSLAQTGKLAAIGQLAAGVAHEMNNPLTVILASAAMIKTSMPAEDEHFELVDLIAQASERAHHVVLDLLDFARREEYVFAPTDVNESLSQALSLVSYQLQTAHIRVNKQLAPDLPLAYASAKHLKTVWINLLINARDALHGRSDDRQLEIMTRAGEPGESLEVFVRDNGPGMTLAEQERIFEPFYTTKEPGKGTGLGLYTCHQIMQQHGGQIEVVSSPGQGTTFIVRLPLATQMPAGAVADSVSPATPRQTVQYSRPSGT